ncbi:MAG: aminoacyl-tRNA hydrolase [Caulobacteraceae bacterium]|nr:aminoacyl-tRNA hydrolase [Caulobacter sp.]
MLILAGLGNPGPKHAGQRHNVGFMAADALHDRWGFSPWRGRFQGFAAEGTVAGERALLLKPQTFMNDSGRSIGEAAKFYKTPPAQVVVFYDEIDMAPGRFRMKTGGGAAGHNGVRSTAAHIGPDFRRARIGVGHPGDKERVMGHVLSDFHKADHVWLDPLLRELADALPLLVAGEDEKYQAEVMRLAPAEKFDSRMRNRDA